MDNTSFVVIGYLAVTTGMRKIIQGYLDFTGQCLVDTEPDSPRVERLPSGNSINALAVRIFQKFQMGCCYEFLSFQ
jgi:hypothetical protein